MRGGSSLCLLSLSCFLAQKSGLRYQYDGAEFIHALIFSINIYVFNIYIIKTCINKRMQRKSIYLSIIKCLFSCTLFQIYLVCTKLLIYIIYTVYYLITLTNYKYIKQKLSKVKSKWHFLYKMEVHGWRWGHY